MVDAITTITDPGDFFGTQGSAAAVKSQEQQNAAELELRAQLAEQAREDVFSLFPLAQEDRRLGTQAALDVFGQSVPQQLGAFQQGNVQAQEALIGGLPQFQNAILGKPVDFSQFQPQKVDFSTAFAQQDAPQTAATQQAVRENIQTDPAANAALQASLLERSKTNPALKRRLEASVRAKAEKEKFERENPQPQQGGGSRSLQQLGQRIR